MPIRVRRILLTLSHLVYLLGPDHDTFARAAVNNSIELARKGKKSCAKDLIKAASRLPFHCPVLVLTMSTSAMDIEDYAKVVQKLMLEWLQSEIDFSDKLYLLHGRREPQTDRNPAQVTSCVRCYLILVKTQKHREAITSVMLSAHLLAVEVLRYVHHEHQPVPRWDRLCRFCKTEVEKPGHALITWLSMEKVVNLRAIFLGELFSALPEMQGWMAELCNAEFLKAIICARSTAVLVAKFMFEVLELFYSVPVFRLDV